MKPNNKKKVFFTLLLTGLLFNLISLAWEHPFSTNKVSILLIISNLLTLSSLFFFPRKKDLDDNTNDKD